MRDTVRARRYLTVPELAARWEISQASAYRHVERGTIAAIRLGGPGSSVRVPIDAVEAYERAQLGRVPSPASDGAA